MKSKKFVMLVGLPGSGKSTSLKTLVPDFAKIFGEFVILSTDDYIEEVAKKLEKTYSEVFTDTINDATFNMNRELEGAIKWNLNIVWDQTNLTVKSRKAKLARIPSDYEKIAIVFNSTRATIEDRLEKRAKETGKYISPAILNSMDKSYEKPTADEGFDSIIHMMS